MLLLACLKTGGAVLEVGQSYVAEDGNRYHCVLGNEGAVRLEFSESKNTQIISFCRYNRTKFDGGESVQIDGATFNCTKKGDHFEWEWESGGECKLKDNSTLAVNEQKREGNVTYKCVAQRLKIRISVKGTVKSQKVKSKIKQLT